MNRRSTHPVLNSFCSPFLWASLVLASLPWTTCPDVQADDIVVTSPNSPSYYAVSPDLQQVQDEIDDMKGAIRSPRTVPFAPKTDFRQAPTRHPDYVLRRDYNAGNL